jgi:Domain of unknown function (DUF4397)
MFMARGAEAGGPVRRQIRALQVVAIGCLAAAGLLAGIGGARAAQPVQAAAAGGRAYLVQGVADETYKIQLDDKVVAQQAAPKSIVGPLDLSAGSHVVTYLSGSTVAARAKFQMVAGNSLDVVVHRTADSSKAVVVTVFVNDLSPVPAGKSRLVVSHVAVAPPADIRKDGKPWLRNVANGESVTVITPAMQASVDVVPTATQGPVILAPVSLTLQAGTLTRVFAIGDPSANTADAVVQVLPVSLTRSRPPTKVSTGDGGQAADVILGAGPGGGTVSLALLAVALLAAAGSRRVSARTTPAIGRRHGR